MPAYRILGFCSSPIEVVCFSHLRDNAQGDNRIGRPNSGCTCKGYIRNAHNGHALVVCWFCFAVKVTSGAKY